MFDVSSSVLAKRCPLHLAKVCSNALGLWFERHDTALHFQTYYARLEKQIFLQSPINIWCFSYFRRRVWLWAFPLCSALAIIVWRYFCIHRRYNRMLFQQCGPSASAWSNCLVSARVVGQSERSMMHTSTSDVDKTCMSGSGRNAAIYWIRIMMMTMMKWLTTTFITSVIINLYRFLCLALLVLSPVALAIFWFFDFSVDLIFSLSPSCYALLSSW